MNLTPLEQINNLVSTDNRSAKPEALRQAARQFEALLLMQLTSALNKTNEGDEDSLFGSDGGTDLAKRMFSEQLATTMADAGGIGLSDLIMRKFGAGDLSEKRSALPTKTLAAVRDIKENAAQANVSPDETISAQLNKNSKVVPLNNAAIITNPQEAEIISTFEDQLKLEGMDDSLQNLMLDGKIQNSTRPRIVPGRPLVNTSVPNSVAELKDVSYRMPVDGRISSVFGNRFHPIDRRVKFHGGIDIAVPRGTSVGAAAEGRVTFAGWKNGYGNLVVIKHPDGRESSYGHLDKITVSVDEAVTAGKQIGLSGSTGKSTGPHLHFELRENGELVNPLKIMSNVLAKNVDR